VIRSAALALFWKGANICIPMKQNLTPFQRAMFQIAPKNSKTPAKRILQGGVLCACLAFLSAARAWDLPQCVGNQKDGWSAGVEDNWSWERGNPLEVDGGGQWTLAGQNLLKPTTTDEYKPLEKALLFTFLKGWAEGGVSPDKSMFLYFGEGQDGRKLVAQSNAEFGFPQMSPAAAILFKVPRDGKYQVAIEGAVTVQSKTAGFARVQIYTLTDKRATEVPLESFELNNKGGCHLGEKELGEKLSYSGSVTMKAGDEIVARLQTISPGPATAGASALVFSKYSIVPADK
jgi:hypothetical protein